MKRCSICGEPVVNNRCVRCGMIVFDDDGVRYHLNENGRDHEAHHPGSREFSVYEEDGSVEGAGKKKKRRAAVRPVRPAVSGSAAARGHAAAQRSTAGRGYAAAQRSTAGRGYAAARTAGNASGRRAGRASAYERPASGKGRKKVLILVVVVFFLITILPSLTEYMTSKSNLFHSSTKSYEWLLERDGYLTFGEGSYTNGEDFPEGEFAVYNEGNGETRLILKQLDGDILLDVTLEDYERLPENLIIDSDVTLMVIGDGEVGLYPLN